MYDKMKWFIDFMVVFFENKLRRLVVIIVFRVFVFGKSKILWSMYNIFFYINLIFM